MSNYYKLVILILSMLIPIDNYANDISSLPLQHPSLSFTETLPRNSRQVWDIEMDKDGVNYFATSEGLITNTYGLWESHTTGIEDNPIFTLAIIKDTIWVGKANEIGYYARNNYGKLIYHKVDDYKQGTVWNIILNNKEIYFQSEYSIYILNTTTNKGRIINATARINNIYSHNQHIYYTLRNGYIGVITGNRLHHIKLAQQLVDKEVRSAIIQNRIHYFSLLDGTILSYNTVSSTVTTITESTNNKIFTTAKLKSNKWAIGSITNGLSFYDIKTRTNSLHQINNQNGLDDNTVLSIAQNKDKQIWVGQDYGLNYIEMNTPYRKVFSGATVYDIVHFNDAWYLATNKGLYYSENGQPFKLYPHSEGQVWSLSHNTTALIVSHINRSFIIDANKEAEKLCALDDVHHISPINEDNNMLLAISHSKTYLCYKDKSGKWLKKEILKTGFTEILESKKTENNSHGFYLTNKTGENVYLEFSRIGIVSTKIKFSADKVFSIGEDIVIIKDGIAYNPIIKYKQISLEANSNYPFNDRINDYSLNINSANNNRDIIIDSNEEILYYNQLKDGTYKKYPNLFGTFSHTLNSTGRHLKVIDSHVFLFSGQSIYSYNLDYRSSHANKGIVISKITTYEEDSISNYYYPVTHQESEAKVYPNITFEYGIQALKFDDVKFCYKLSSSNEDYSPWSEERKLQFTNLKNGEHTLYIKAKINDIEYPTMTVNFTVDGHWYHKALWQTILGILFTFITILLANFRYKIRMKSKMETVKKHHTKDLLRTRNQQSIEFLARIEQKNLFLEKIKTSLSSMRNEKARDLIRLIEAESKKESKDFVYFNFFADNQQDFMSAISRKYPNLTTNDLRLILFIKLNMSTKDISAITHTTAASVEKARYRLRKKLLLDNEASLSKYLLRFEKKYVNK